MINIDDFQEAIKQGAFSDEEIAMIKERINPFMVARCRKEAEKILYGIRNSFIPFGNVLGNVSLNPACAESFSKLQDLFRESGISYADIGTTEREIKEFQLRFFKEVTKVLLEKGCIEKDDIRNNYFLRGLARSGLTASDFGISEEDFSRLPQATW